MRALRAFAQPWVTSPTQINSPNGAPLTNATGAPFVPLRVHARIGSQFSTRKTKRIQVPGHPQCEVVLRRSLGPPLRGSFVDNLSIPGLRNVRFTHVCSTLGWLRVVPSGLARSHLRGGGHTAPCGRWTTHAETGATGNRSRVGGKGRAIWRVSPPPTPPHNVADWSESVKTSSFAATLRGGGHVPTRERLRKWRVAANSLDRGGFASDLGYSVSSVRY
jgi:hypothetical protein